MSLQVGAGKGKGVHSLYKHGRDMPAKEVFFFSESVWNGVGMFIIKIWEGIQI